MSGFVAAWRFLTVIPLGRREDDGADLARSLAWFPVVGLILGACLVVFQAAAARVFPAILVDLLCVIFLVVLTGGLHLDGLADTMDGLGGRNREEALRIMKDAALGSFGAVAIFSAIGLKVAGLWALPIEVKAWALLLFPVMGRWAMVALASTTPYARREGGTGQAFVEESSVLDLAIATTWTLALVLGLMDWRGAAGLLAVVVAVVLLRWLFVRWLGGVTGDTLGAAGEGAEILVLLVLAAVA